MIRSYCFDRFLIPTRYKHAMGYQYEHILYLRRGGGGFWYAHIRLQASIHGEMLRKPLNFGEVADAVSQWPTNNTVPAYGEHSCDYSTMY